MKKDIIKEENNHTPNVFNSALEEILREGARKLLQQAIEQEVNDHIEMFKNVTEDNDKRSVIRNGYLPERQILTGIGPINVKQPRVRDKGKKSPFTSALLPRYARKVPSIEALVPTLYLKGVSTGDFLEALEAILGENAKGLSHTTICRLKETWQQEFKEWNNRDLSNKHYVYVWADGIYFNVRLSDDRPCVLVLIGALPSGKKEVIAIQDGERESTLSWKGLLLNLKRRGLSTSPSLAIGDGALGFWKAIEEVFPGTRCQRCWVHKTANVLDKMPKKIQPRAKSMIHEMYQSSTKNDALKIYSDFIDLYDAKYPRACECLRKDKAILFTFYDFPALHWQHIRTTNPIESTFATTRRTKGCGSREATLSMVYKLVMGAEKHWRCLKGSKMVEKVVRGVKFVNGEEQKDQEKVA